MKYHFIKTILVVILPFMIILGCKKNHPPYTPYTPIGPSVGSINNEYNFSALAIDPDGDSVAVRFDWGDGDTTFWSSDWDLWLASEKTFTLSHSWLSFDTFYIRTQAKDKKENVSEWSMPHSIVITSNPLNNPPDVPLISGPSSGYIQTCYEFFGLAVDQDSDKVSIRFDWGDGDTSGWSTLTSSGDSIWMQHTWMYSDTFYVRAQAKDSIGLTSAWSLAHYIEITSTHSSDSIGWICATPWAGWPTRESHATVAFHNKIWVTGGHCCPDEVWSSLDGVNWTCETDSAGFGIRYDFPMVVFNNKIWVIAGEDGNSMNDVWCSADGANWIQITNSAQWEPRQEHTAVVFNDKIWVLGGITGGVQAFK